MQRSQSEQENVRQPAHQSGWFTKLGGRWRPQVHIGRATARAQALQAFAHGRVTLIHALVGASWILASDRVLALATTDAAQLHTLQTYKGLAYVAATTLMLYLLIEHVARSLSRSQHSLLEQQRELQALLANLPGGVYRRGQGQSAAYSLLSPRAAALLGVTVGPSQHTFQSIVHEADRALVEQRLQAALRARQPFEVWYRVVGAQGNVRWIWDQGRCFEAEDGSLQIEGYVCDVTEHRRLQERLQHAQRMESVGCMASSIAHDFNNVLFAIGSGCELLTYQPLSEMEQDLVSTMRSASDTGRGLVARLMAFARDQGCNTCELELNAVVTRAQPLMKRVLPRKVELKLALALPGGTVQADATQLEQILLNLITNAGQAIDGRGLITVSTSTVELAEGDPLGLVAGSYLCLAVEDTGCGIDPAVLPRIFDPFFTTKGEAGTGLGLATVQRIVRDMGGAISVRSEPTRGTRFSVLLPAVQPVPSALSAPPAAPSRGSELPAQLGS